MPTSGEIESLGAAASILTYLSPELQEKYINLSRVAANSSPIAALQQLLVNDQAEMLAISKLGGQLAETRAQLLSTVEGQGKFLSSRLDKLEDEIASQSAVIINNILGLIVLVKLIVPGPAARIILEEEQMDFVTKVGDPPKRFKIKITDAGGNLARVDGAPQWSSSDESILTVAQDDDGMAAEVSAAGKSGNAQVTVSADADLGAGVTTITGLGNFEVLPGDAVTIDIEPE